MTQNEYIKLVQEFNLDYDNCTSSAYYKLYPVCGYRLDASDWNEYNWKDNSLIIFEKFSHNKNYNGKYSGEYTGKSAVTLAKARKLIGNQIKTIKEIYLNNKLKTIEEDF
jgi:hypothetical protein